MPLVVALVLLGAVPLLPLALKPLMRRASGIARLGKALAVVALALAFHVSVLAMWGACRLLVDAALAPYFLGALVVIGTPTSLFVSWRLVFSPS